MTAGSGVPLDAAALGRADDVAPRDDIARPPRRWPGVLAVIVGILAAYSLVALIGGAQDAREERVLGVFTPVFEWLRDNGGAAREWLHAQRYAVGLVGTGLLIAVGAAALAHAGRRAGPVVLLVVSFGLVGWAQVALQSNATTVGLILYLAGVAGGVGLGIWCPFTRLASMPPFPPAGRRTTALPFGWECGLVFGLTMVALVLRTWALTELYDFFDLEMIDSMVQARTWAGYKGYLGYGFVQNNGGAIHLLPAQLTFRLFGTGIFTLRMTAVLWSISAVPLMYLLGRRIAGVPGAVFCSLFLITAPEQLFWARNENVFFSAVAICALVTVHVTLWMVQRLSPWAVLVTALWMPWCRWFYSASVASFLVPIAAALHAMLFVPRLWRKVWYVVPILALGVGGFLMTLTVLRAALQDWKEWRYVDPTAFYGASAWRKQGEFANASIPELMGLQAVSLSKNFAEVARNMTYQTDNFSHWCQRSQPADHRTILNVGLTMLVFVGLGYLVGQIHDRRAFLLVVFWGLSVLPAILSQEVADRRMAMVFPASFMVGGVALAAFLYLIVERGGRLAEMFAGVTTALALGAIALTSLAAHLLLPINPVLLGDYPRFAKPLLEESDAVFTNLPPPFRTFSVFGNLDHFLAQPTCLQFVEPERWLRTALDPTCRFDDAVYGFSIGAAGTERLRQTYDPKRISFLLNEDPVSAPQIALLTELFPDAELKRHPVARAERTLVAMSVDIDDIKRLHAPTRRGHGPADVLAGVATRPAADDGTEGADTTIEGGVLIDNDGWYRWRLDPPCPAAALAFDGEPASADALRPMLAGVHAFTLTVPAAAACALPLRIVMDGANPDHRGPLAPQSYVSPSVARLDAVRAAPVDTFAGYGAPALRQEFKSRPIDFGSDEKGRLSVLFKESDGHHVRRYNPRGKEIADWRVEVPPTINPASLGVTHDGFTAVLVQNRIQMYDPKGNQVANWMHPWFVWESQLAFWGDLLISNIHHRDALAVYTRDGKLVREIKTFDGGPGRFYAPMAFALTPDGDLLVQQADGLALRFRVEGPDFTPVFVESFRVDAASPGSGFDGPDRILIATERGLRAFGAGGTRLMANEPGRDPTQLPFGTNLHVRRVGDELLVLDTDRTALWRVTP